MSDGKKCYAVIFYTNRREENSWKLHSIYENKQDAIDFAYTLPRFEKKYEDFVKPPGNIVFKTTCGMEHPLRKEILIGEDRKKYEEEYKLYKSDCKDFEYPFNGLSWDCPQICIIEMPLIKNKKQKEQPTSE